MTNNLKIFCLEGNFNFRGTSTIPIPCCLIQELVVDNIGDENVFSVLINEDGLRNGDHSLKLLTKVEGRVQWQKTIKNGAKYIKDSKYFEPYLKKRKHHLGVLNIVVSEDIIP